MRIRCVEIENFGGLSDFRLEMRDGLQVVYGGNEDGKSTLMAFLKLLFYGDTGRASAVEKNPRRRSRPWNGRPMSGAVEFEHGGVRYHLSKTFGDTPRKDRVSLVELTTGLEVPLGKEEEAGARFLGLTLSEFERTCFIGSTGAIAPDGKEDDIARRLMANLSSSGEEDVSPAVVLGRLTGARDKLVSKRGDKGELAAARRTLDELHQERAAVQLQLDGQRDVQARVERLRERQKERAALTRLIEADKLAGLLDTAEELEKAEELLGRPGLPLEELPAYMDELDELVRDWEARESGLRAVLASGRDGGEVLTPVNGEELEQARRLAERETVCGRISAFVREELVPAEEEAERQRQAAETAKQEAAARRNETETLAPARERRQRLTEAERELAGELERKRLWLRDKQAVWEQQRDVARQRAALAAGRRVEPGRFFLLLLSAGAAVGVLTTAAALLTGQGWWLTGWIAAVLLIGLSFVTRRGKEAASANEAEQALAEAEAALAKEASQAKRELEELEDRLRAVEEEMGSQKAAADRYEPAMQALTAALDREKQAVLLLETREQALADAYRRLLGRVGMLADTGISVPPLPETAGEFDRERFEAFLRAEAGTARDGLTALLTAKGCGSFEELQQRYQAYQSDKSNQQAIGAAARAAEEARDRLLAKAQAYDAVGRPEDARELRDTLRRQWTALSGRRTEMEHIARGMELPAAPAVWRARLEECRRDAGTGYAGASAEELRQRLAALGEDETAQLLELQKQLRTPERLPEQIDADIRAAQESVREMEAYDKALYLAIQGMERAVEELRQSFSPELNKRTGEIFAALTGGKYEDLLVSPEYAIRTKAGSQFVEYGYLSAGTVDQAYLSLRLAMSRLIAGEGEPLPLFLDDVLMQYDDERAARCLRFLQEYAADGQVMLLTCHGFLADQARRLSVPCVPLARGKGESNE